MLQKLSRALTEKGAGGKLEPRMVKASAPMLVSIAVTIVGGDLEGFSIQCDETAVMCFYALAVPIAVKSVDGAEKARSQNARVTGDGF